MREKLPLFSYAVIVIALFFYSFTQVDLGLAFSKSESLQKILFSFQQIGYFNRPLSTTIYILLIALMFVYYAHFLYVTFKKRIKTKNIWILIGFTAFVLAFSYNAFSYDLFNYIFDAKIITYYNQNPYIHKALDFPGDPMLSFMHWTHRTYPYGPIWLALTVPLSYIGSNIFLLTFFLFKFFLAGLYLGSVYLIYLINKKILPQYQNFNLVLFALNPLVVIESLVSSHNDIAMIFFALFGLYLFFSGRRVLSIILVAFSAAIKIPSISLLPPIILSLFPIKLRLEDQKFIWTAAFFSIASLSYVLTQLEIQPWYFLWVFPFLCMLKPNKYIIALLVGASFGLLLRYTPYLYSGNWNGSAPQVKEMVTLLTPLIFLFCVFLFSRLKPLWKKY